MTDTERERLAGLDDDVEDIKVYQAKSRVRRRIEEELTFDVEILADNHPDLLEELRTVVCESNSSLSTESVTESVDTEQEAADADRAVDTEQEATDTEEIPTPDMGANVDDRVREAVEAVAGSWADTDERLETRKDAAAVVLQHALSTGEVIGKSSDVVADVQAAFPVEAQKSETYWRKNIRPVLKEYGQYSQAQHGYIVDSLD